MTFIVPVIAKSLSVGIFLDDSVHDDSIYS